MKINNLIRWKKILKSFWLDKKAKGDSKRFRLFPFQRILGLSIVKNLPFLANFYPLMNFNLFSEFSGLNYIALLVRQSLFVIQ
jgi:hypothetical protein